MRERESENTHSSKMGFDQNRMEMPRRETNNANDDTGRKEARAGSRKERLKLIDPLLRLFTKYPVLNRARANRHAVSRRMIALRAHR